MSRLLYIEALCSKSLQCSVAWILGLNRLKLDFFGYVCSVLISCVLAFQLSCIDCGVVFDQQSVQAHTSCVTETVMAFLCVEFSFHFWEMSVSVKGYERFWMAYISQILTWMLTYFQGLYSWSYYYYYSVRLDMSVSLSYRNLIVDWFSFTGEIWTKGWKQSQ